MNTLLFVPAVEKMIRKIPTFNADAYIVDLEDSVRDDSKEQALETVAAFLKKEVVPAEKIFVRLNGDRIERELAVLAALPFDGYMIPKFEEPDQYAASEICAGGKRVAALVETPRGILNIEKIAAADWVDAIAFGAEDYSAGVGMKNSMQTLLPVRSRIVVAAKAFGKPVYDTPSFILDDEEALAREATHAADLGFDGKLAIHPRQLPCIREAFMQYDIAYLRSVVERYEAGQEAVLRIDGRVYEKMHIAHMKRIIKERG